MRYNQARWLEVIMAKQLTYCPVCSHKLTTREDGGRIRQACANCGYVHYVNPVPTVGVVIEMDGGVVLIKRNRPPHKGMWALPSGYIEADESAEEGAIREAEEETGLKVDVREPFNVFTFKKDTGEFKVGITFLREYLGGEVVLSDEHTDYRWIDPREFADMDSVPSLHEEIARYAGSIK